jgi:hypothetical protein
MPQFDLSWVTRDNDGAAVSAVVQLKTLIETAVKIDPTLFEETVSRRVLVDDPDVWMHPEVVAAAEQVMDLFRRVIRHWDSLREQRTMLAALVLKVALRRVKILSGRRRSSTMTTTPVYDGDPRMIRGPGARVVAHQTTRREHVAA